MYIEKFEKEKLLQSVAIIKQKKPGFVPKVGLILGSGLGPLADELQDVTVISYKDLPGFPVSTVAGHAGELLLGTLNEVPVACLKGRVHLYEGASCVKLQMIVRSLRLLGCHSLIVTSAVGSMLPHMTGGDVAVVKDHINFSGINPLCGPDDEEFGPRFVEMNHAYDLDYRLKILSIAADLGIELPEGISAVTLGPTFETPAEIRAFISMGADLVGMSMPFDVIVARHCGLRVLGLAAIVNAAAGMTKEPPSHEGTLKNAKICGEKLCQLVREFLHRHRDELLK